MTAHVVNADIMEWARTYDGPKFHAILCDPPYHLYDIERTFQAKAGSVDSRTGRVRSNQRRAAGGGFMGKQWDGGDIAFDPATWAALAEHLHPGGFVMAFASSRGWHRLACAIEDAGLRIHPSIFGWGFGSGFPKATRIDTQIDKAAGAEREVVGRRITGAALQRTSRTGEFADGQHGGTQEIDIEAPATPLAAAWEGHRYGGQALKPALEPIIVAQKPYAGRPVDSITATGAGALWVDGGRVATGDNLNGGAYSPGERERGGAAWGNGKGGGIMRGAGGEFAPPAGRWPPNLVLSHVSLPVVRLRGQLPDGIIDAIGRYYNGYIRVQELRRGRGDNGVEIERRSEVLQQGVQERISSQGGDTGTNGVAVPPMRPAVPCAKRVGQGRAPEVLREGMPSLASSSIDGRTIAALGEASLAGVAGQDWQNPDQTRVDGQRPGSPVLERGEAYQQRVHIGSYPNVAAGGSGDGPHDAPEAELHLRASAGFGNEIGPAAVGERGCSPSERCQTRQSTGESGSCGQVEAQSGASTYRAGAIAATCGELQLEILACDVPDCWTEYFEPTGENLGCQRVGTRRVRGNGHYPPERTPNSIYGNGAGTNIETGWNDERVTTETVAAWDCAPECPVRRLGEQSGELQTHGGGVKRHLRNRQSAYGMTGGAAVEPSSGTAARFFPNPDYSLDIAEAIAAADPVMYCAKASRRERNAGMPDGQRSSHPTVKPISLAIWLAKLLLPPDAYAPRRCLIPFAGSGSEMVGAMLAGWEDVVGIEREAEYVAIAEARLAWWDANRDKAPEVRAMGPSEAATARHDSDGGLAHKSPAVALGAFRPTRHAHATATPPMLPGLATIEGGGK